MRAEDRERLEFLSWSLETFPRFCGLLDIIPKDGRRRKLTLNPIQKRFNVQRTGRDIVLKPRQVGFTTLEQARDIWHFLTFQGARVTATCQSITDHTPAKLLAKNYRVMFEGLERAGLKLNFRTRSNNEWTLADRDAELRIVEAGASEAAAEKKGRAGTISRLHLTETAFYEYADQTLNAMLECVPSPDTGSEIVSESTPNGASGYFYKQCKAAQRGDSSYTLHFYPWFKQAEYAIPLKSGELIAPRGEREERIAKFGITPEQLKWFRAKSVEKGEDLTDQEYPSDPETCFLVSGRGFFDRNTTTRLLAQTREPIERRDRERVRIFKKPEPGREYVLAVDTSEGGDGDPSGGVMYERATAEHVATIDGQFPPHDLARCSAELGLRYNTAVIAVERNNHGHAVLQALEREQKYPRIYIHEDDKPGFPTTPVTRPQIIDALEAAHRLGQWKSPDSLVLSQFRTFVVINGKPQAAPGEFDDLVLSSAIGWEVRQKPVFNYGPAPAALQMM